MNKLLMILILAAGAGGAWWYLRQRPASGGAAAASPPARQTEAVVGRRDINFSVGVAGEIGPAEQVSVRPEVNGRINELPVDVGDRVTKGSLLFALDDKDLRLELETQQKQVESAKLQLEKARIAMVQAERDYERDRRLFEEKLVAEQVFETTRQRWDSSKQDFELAKNSIERAEKQFALSEEKLSRTRIVAPFDCTILTRPVSIGQAVSGSGGFNSGTEVLTIADLNALVINAHVNQADVTRLKQGMEVSVAVDAIPGLSITGLVERIAPQATVRNNIKGFGTRILLKTPDARIQPGMTANISIPVAATAGALAVPLSAVFTEQGRRYVYVRRNGGWQRQDVTIGASDYFHAEVKEGLAEGDIVTLEKPQDAAAAPPAPALAAGQSRRPGGT
ncbi:MAG: efflux RND transporter periplasmic adaptor subunit [Limisphaerales bacterium]